MMRTMVLFCLVALVGCAGEGPMLGETEEAFTVADCMLSYTDGSGASHSLPTGGGGTAGLGGYFGSATSCFATHVPPACGVQAITASLYGSGVLNSDIHNPPTAVTVDATTISNTMAPPYPPYSQMKDTCLSSCSGGTCGAGTCIHFNAPPSGQGWAAIAYGQTTSGCVTQP